MERLRSQELQATLEFLREAYVLRDLQAFARYVISALPKVVASDHTSYNEVNLSARRNATISEPHIDARLLEPFTRHMAEHSLITHYAKTSDGRALKMSDFLTQRQFHRLGLYQEFFRRVNVEHQIAFVLPAPPSLVVGIALNRSRPDFSDRERLVLDVLRPHVIQAYRNAEAVGLIMQSVETLRRAIVLLTRAGKVTAMSDRARQWLCHYFGRVSPRRGDLPEALWRWVRQHEALLDTRDDVPRPQRPLVVDHGTRRLVLRLFTSSSGNLLLLEEQGPPEPGVLEGLGLTQREAEVLAWVVQGKTNPEIASILGTRRRTVSKQLERIHQKLGVETRTAAATLAMTFLSSALP